MFSLRNKKKLSSNYPLSLSISVLTLLHSDRPKLHTILAFLSAVGLFKTHMVTKYEALLFTGILSLRQVYLRGLHVVIKIIYKAVQTSVCCHLLNSLR